MSFWTMWASRKMNIVWKFKKSIEISCNGCQNAIFYCLERKFRTEYAIIDIASFQIEIFNNTGVSDNLFLGNNFNKCFPQYFALHTLHGKSINVVPEVDNLIIPLWNSSWMLLRIKITLKIFVCIYICYWIRICRIIQWKLYTPIFRI